MPINMPAGRCSHASVVNIYAKATSTAGAAADTAWTLNDHNGYITSVSDDATTTGVITVTLHKPYAVFLHATAVMISGGADSKIQLKAVSDIASGGTITFTHLTQTADANGATVSGGKYAAAEMQDSKVVYFHIVVQEMSI